MTAGLALHGGAPLAPQPLGRRWPEWGEPERALLNEVLQSGKWWRGAYQAAEDSKVGQFEGAFARFQDARHAVAVTNGTTALECAYRAAGVEAGDEVIVPAVTFVATATAVLQVGAVPVFVDVDPRTYTVDSDAVGAAITDRTLCIAPVDYGGIPCDYDELIAQGRRHDNPIVADSAHAHGTQWKGTAVGAVSQLGTFSLKSTLCIAPVDYGGIPCDYDALIALGRRHDIPILADCAHAHGTQLKGTGVGALTQLGTFSFQMGKALTTGEGGMVLTNDDTLAAKVYSYHHIGRIKDRPFYEHHVPASNLRMTEWQGAIGLAQLARLEEQTATREANSRYLAAGLEQLRGDGIGVAPIFRDERVTRWGFYMWHFKFLPEAWRGPSRDQFLKALRAEGITAGTGHTQPLYKNPLFQDAEHAFGRTGFPVRGQPYGKTMDYSRVVCPQTERIYATEAVHLSHPQFLGGRGDMDTILGAIEKIWRHRGEL